jgi:hypothetical protein
MELSLAIPIFVMECDITKCITALEKLGLTVSVYREEWTSRVLMMTSPEVLTPDEILATGSLIGQVMFKS